jgi:hypothetical protein
MPTTTKAKPKKRLSPAAYILQLAKRRAAEGLDWTDLHNAIFGVGAEFGKLFPTREAREEFFETKEYAEIKRLLAARYQPPAPSANSSGKFVVRLPRSLHAALVAEADAEGTSLNQLIVAKLSAQLKAVLKGASKH